MLLLRLVVALICSGKLAEGAASGPLLGGKYVPTSDVEHIEELTELIDAIQNEPSQDRGNTFYTDVLREKISLESLSNKVASNNLQIYLNPATNPLYNVYMYSLYRSPHGSGYEKDDTRDMMKFLSEDIDNYGHTIIQDELKKQSGYDRSLTTETIRVISVWMSTIQSLYDAVKVCEQGGGLEVLEAPEFVNPVDAAAAFWFGNLDDENDTTGGSMYAWAARARDNFVLQSDLTGFDANKDLLTDLNTMQGMLNDCMDFSKTPDIASRNVAAKEMRELADGMSGKMTVPMVQNFIHYGTLRATSISEDILDQDYMILYALSTLPPIGLCDDAGFDTLYDTIVTKSNDLTAPVWSSALEKIQSRFICLGVTCDQVGTSKDLQEGLESGTFPECRNPDYNLDGYIGSDPEDMVQFSLVDLDVQTIGTLVAMDAPTAAYDIYKYGRFSKSSALDYLSMKDRSKMQYNARNTVGAAFLDYTPPGDEYYGNQYFVDTVVNDAILGLEFFEEATAQQKRIIAEGTMVMSTLHICAIDMLFDAIDVCEDATDGTMSAGSIWDAAVATLTGWAEGDETAEGLLFFTVSRALCTDDTCEDGKNQINDLLVTAFKDGKDELQKNNCAEAESKIQDIEKLLQTILADIVALFAEKRDGTNVLAEGYGAVSAILPFVNKVDTGAASILKKHMGTYKSGAFQDKRPVFSALQSFVEKSNIDCSLLSRDICGDRTEGTYEDEPGEAPVDDPASGSTTLTDYDATPESVAVASPHGGDYWNDSLCQSGVSGGLPNNSDNDEASEPLLGGAYVPTSNVDHIVKLTESVEAIAATSSMSEGEEIYKQTDENGVSLQCLSTGVSQPDIAKTNPLYVQFMYGLWISESGDNDADGYSSKTFDDGDILYFGDTIVQDEFTKSSGYDPKLTAETIRVMNVWMAMTTELYRSTAMCRDGYDDVPASFNPVDFAAALYFGTATDPDLVNTLDSNGSLYAWAKRAGNQFVDESIGVNDEIISKLKDLQKSFQDCRGLLDDDRERKGLTMRDSAREITNLMMVPMVQNFLSHLASQSGIIEEADAPDQRNFMVLYSLATLPYISICGENAYDDLFEDLVVNLDSYDSGTFRGHVETFQGKYHCMGVTCDQVGSLAADDNWPQCQVEAAVVSFAGYTPTSGVASKMAKIDLDMSSVLAFIVMGANDAAYDVYNNGWYVRGSDGKPFQSIGNMSTQVPLLATNLYDTFTKDDGIDYTQVTKDAIQAAGAFQYTSPLLNSAAASLAMTAIDLHLHIITKMYLAVDHCLAGVEGVSIKETTDTPAASWDSAVACAVGSAEGSDERVEIEGYVLYDLAEEMCSNFQSCNDDGKSQVNVKLIEEFSNGQSKLAGNKCEEAQNSAQVIESYIQAILVDTLAYHARYASTEKRHCTMANIATNALVPLIRPVCDTCADKLFADFGGQKSAGGSCIVDDIDAVYQALKQYVEGTGIDCSLLGSKVCDGTVSIDDPGMQTSYDLNPEEDETTVESERHFILNREYEPISDVKKISVLSTVLGNICNADDESTASEIYSNDESIGISLKSMSLAGKQSLIDELVFNQYVYALHDDVDLSDGSLQFDDRPATDYADTITGDALETNIPLGCESVKILNVWMWIVHKLNEAVQECKAAEKTENYRPLDEAAALWESGLLFEMAEQLGPKFGHGTISGMIYLNRMIVDRLVAGSNIISKNDNMCSERDALDLRIITKETISYMTAVLIQGMIDAVFGSSSEKITKERTELMGFAVLPRIKTCGHETMYGVLYDDLVVDGYTAKMNTDIMNALHNHLNCLGLKCDDIGRYSAADASNFDCVDDLDIASYSPTNATKTNMAAKIDLDVVAIHQMMSIERYGIALSIYTDGLNYYDYDSSDYNFVSLQDLTNSQTIGFTDFATYTLFNDYFGPGYLDQLLLETISGTKRFATATSKQLDLATLTAVSSLLSFLTSLEALSISVSQCTSGRFETALTAFDGGVALLIGSVEGTRVYGDAYSEGKMLFSVGKRVCSYFRNCKAGNAEVNQKLIELLKTGQELLRKEDCEGAQANLDDITMMMRVPLLQQLLFFGERYSDHAFPDDLAAAYIGAQAALPIVDEIAATAAVTIRDAVDFPKTEDDDTSGIIRSAFTDMFSSPTDMDCLLIAGKLHFEICGGEDTVTGDSADDAPTTANTSPVEDMEEQPETDPQAIPNRDEPMPISDGLYIATTYVGDRSAIALDVKEIKERLEVGDVDEAEFTYKHGRNSKIYDINGLPTGDLRAIKDFSIDSEVTMLNHPTYNIFLHGLADKKFDFMGSPASLYADTFISSLLYSKTAAASDAMVAVSIWMQVAHNLHLSYAACKASFLSSDYRELKPTKDPSLFVDEAAAYWIGDSQDTGSASEGHLLYALTEFISSKYENIPEGSQSSINTRVLDLFNKAKNHLAITQGCTTSKDSHLSMREIVNELIPIMAVPLLRSLFYYISVEDSLMVKVYAVAVLPLFSACASSTYLELKSELIDNDIYEFEEAYLYSKIESMFSCIGVTCDEVGFMPEDDFTRCTTTASLHSLAGYRYGSDLEKVTKRARLDIDMKRIDILMTNGITRHSSADGGTDKLFAAAFEMYQYGTSPSVKDSLVNLAKDTGREIVPVFESFKRYYQFQSNYADQIITNAFQGQDVFQGASFDDRRRAIMFVLQYMVSHMAILQQLYTSLDTCNRQRKSDSILALDLAAATYIGSLEGKSDGGSYDGSLIYGFAMRMCVHFGTCTVSYNARANERIISLFYSAQGEAEAGACDALGKTVKEIESTMLVPLIQGTIFIANENQLYFKKNTPSAAGYYPEGFILAQTILPIIHDVDQSAASDISGVMVEGFPDPEMSAASQPAKVFRAVQTALAKIDGINCDDVGTILGSNFCPGASYDNISPAFGARVATLTQIAIMGIVYFLGSCR